MSILKSLLIVVLFVFGGGIAGFFIPFIIAQFDGNPAWSFVPMITVPIGFVVGLVIGIYFGFWKS
ncbi:MAG: hypothetical protein H3C43_05370 [Leptonema sp. (in: Bacteria)]|nr:hypothetical protein [Leptonema sp. (in: bacteria)]